jgi:NADH-quinone oxidoreductase subunit B
MSQDTPAGATAPESATSTSGSSPAPRLSEAQQVAAARPGPLWPEHQVRTSIRSFKDEEIERRLEAEGVKDSFITTKLAAAVNWARKFSLFQYPFVTACCGMEYMSVSGSHYDTARFGAEVPRFSPRQADLLFVVGTVVHKNATVLRLVYDQMTEPKWVIAFGACASTGGFYDNYAAVPGIDHIIPVDVYIPGCPPRPEQVIDALMKLQDQIQQEPLRIR